jgi:phospholipid/cholesterol/gamma-HCH transport system ATP-binding protein
MIDFDDVSISFDSPVLSDISFTLPQGASLGLLGAGGSGKSVLLKLCCGLLKPQTGRVLVDGQSIPDLNGPALAEMRGRIGMAFQNSALFDFMTVGENIAFPLRQLGTIEPQEIKSRISHVLEQVSLSGIEGLAPSDLSGGMRKRVCLARAVIHRPTYLLCDDPTAGLDPVTASRIFRMVNTLRREQNATVIVVSHDTNGLFSFCDYTALLENQRLSFFGPTTDALGHPKVRRFVHGHAHE